MGEAYTDAIWDTPDIAAVISWFALNMNTLQGDKSDSSTLAGVNLLKAVNWFRHLKRSNTIATSRRNIAEHYDLGNDFYSLWLDETMTYSSAKFTPETATLAEAQTEKYDALCRKLRLSENDHVLEIGCGWGGFSCHAAGKYGCKVTAVTISEAQAEYARTLSTWHETFNARLPEIRKLGFDTPFIRTWNYYLKYCEAGFATRNISVVQAVYTRPNNRNLETSNQIKASVSSVVNLPSTQALRRSATSAPQR